MDYGMSVMLISKALDGLHLRQVATAQNIANANSVNYVPQEVSFEASLAAAAKSGPEAVQAFHVDTYSRPYSTQNAEMRLDLEMASASQTALRYSALVEILGRRMQIAHLSVRGVQ